MTLKNLTIVIIEKGDIHNRKGKEENLKLKR
jgi:hypothetical protein